MPYYPPASGGGTGPGEVPDLQAVLISGGEVTGPYAIDLSNSNTGGLTFVSAGLIDVASEEGNGDVSLNAKVLDTPAVTWSGGTRSTTVALTRGNNSEFIEVRMPATSGTLALQSEVATVDASVETLERALDAAVVINSTQQGQITTLQTAVSDHQATINTLTIEVSQLKNDYNALLLRVVALENASSGGA